MLGAQNIPFIASEQELVRACRTLFGIDSDISRDFLEYLQLPGIKSAYRKKARETHPDLMLARGSGTNTSDVEAFQVIQQAYEALTSYLKAREQGFRFPSSHQSPRSSFNSNTRRDHRSKWECNQAARPAPNRQDSSKQFTQQTESYYQGPIPERKLLFGHYLYYSGFINWRLIIQALIWQRTNRPRLGELACRLGWISESDILTTLKNRKTQQPFGQTALELGLLTESQLNLLIAQQLRLQKKFGSYFVENNILTQEQLIELIINHRRHNARFDTEFGKTFTQP